MKFKIVLMTALLCTASYVHAFKKEDFKKLNFARRWSIQTGKPVVFHKGDFGKAKFQSENLVEAKFVESIFSEADFTQAILDRVIFTKVKACNTIFINTSMKFAQLIRSDFFKALFSETNLTQACCRDSRFEQAFLLDVDFSGADLTNVNFCGAYLKNVNFAHVRNFQKIANVKGASFINVRGLSVKDVQFLIKNGVKFVSCAKDCATESVLSSRCIKIVPLNSTAPISFPEDTLDIPVDSVETINKKYARVSVATTGTYLPRALDIASGWTSSLPKLLFLK